MSITININKEDLSQYAKKTDIPSLDGYAKESWVETKGYLTEHQSLTDYMLKTDNVNINQVTDLPNTLTEITDKTKLLDVDGNFTGTVTANQVIINGKESLFNENGEFSGTLSKDVVTKLDIPNNKRILEIAEGSTKFAEASAVTAVGTRINTLANLSLNGDGIDMTQNGNTLAFRENYDNATFKATYLFQNRGKSITSGNSIIPGCRVVLEITANTGYKINGSGSEYWQIKTKGGNLPLSQTDIRAISSEEVVNLIGSGYTEGHTYLCFTMPTTIIPGQLEYTGTITLARN